MKITQLRNATIVLEFVSAGEPVVLLVDPMLADQGALPPLKLLVGKRRRNPLVELPASADALLGRVTHTLVTHCQRGHFDHLDRAAKRFLRERQLPVLCMPRDKDYLVRRGLKVMPLGGMERQAFFGGHITPIRCRHGRGWVGRLMEHGVGYFIELPGEPTLYLAGDTVLSDEVARCLRELDPEVSVLPAGGARMDLGSEILMDADELCEAGRLTTGVVVVNHLEALDHCPVSREQVRQAAAAAGLSHRLRVPLDGEAMEFRAGGDAAAPSPDSWRAAAVR